jgi:membrane-associated phospholipid phosphatase
MATKRRKQANRVERADIAVAEAFTPIRKRKVVKALGAASEVGDQPPLYALSAGVLAAGILTKDRATARAGLRMLAAHFLTIRAKNLGKHLIDRTRPDLIPEQGRYEMRKGKRFDTDYNSFPSGHTASSVAVARAVGREFPGLHGGAIGLASVIAGAQVVRSKHYVSDLVAGAAIGIAAELLVDRWLRKMAQP